MEAKLLKPILLATSLAATFSTPAHADEASDEATDIMEPDTHQRCERCPEEGGGGGRPAGPPTVTWIPENEAVNALDGVGQLVRSEHWVLNGDTSKQRCLRIAQERVTTLRATHAFYYHHQDSTFLGTPDGPGHCYAWTFDRRTDRLALLGSALLATVTSALPPDVRVLATLLSDVRDAERKVSGLRFRKFAFSHMDSSDVCLKKAAAWQSELGAAWVVPQKLFDQCVALASQESFAR
jgi:hypothetical protein